MAHLLRMPGVSADATEALLEAWTISEGDSFEVDEPLATIETDKAVVEIEAETPGTLLRILAAPGSTVAVGQPIAVIAELGESVSDVDSVLAELGAAAAVEFEEAADSVAVNELEAGTADVTARAAAESSGGDEGGLDAPGVAVTGGANSGRVFASPLARKLAKVSGLDYTTIPGTGPNGRVRRRDVEAVLQAGSHTSAQPHAVSSVATTGDVSTAAQPRVERQRPGQSGHGVEATYDVVEHTKLRRAVASRLTHSKQTVPHFYVRGSARVDRLVALRKEINQGATVKVSFNDLVLKAAAATHVLHPGVNVSWTEEAVQRYQRVDIAVAIASERGLVTPVLRGVESMTVTSVAASVQDFVQRANDGKLRQDELEGGSLSVSNLGMYGTEEFSAIINPPQAAILAVGAIRDEVVAVDGKPEVCKMLRFVLSVDHRPVDGALAAAWMRTFIEILEHPVRIVA